MLTQEQLEARRAGIGGSDIAAVCGVSRWRSPMDVYLDKIGAAGPLEQNEPMYWGSKLEAAICERFAEEHPEFAVVPWGDAPSVIHPAHPWALALPDAMLYADDGSGSAMYDHPLAGLEVKTASAWKRAEWDEDTVPTEYVFQATWYMIVTGLKQWYMAVLIGGNEYREFLVEYDGVLAAELLVRGRTFWSKVEALEPPPIDGSDASRRFLAEAYPAGEVVSEPVALDATVDDLARQRIALKAAAKSNDMQLQEVENLLKAAMGEHTEGTTPGGYVVTWRPRSRSGIDTKALAEAHPKITARFATVSTYRVLDVKEGKDGSA